METQGVSSGAGVTRNTAAEWPAHAWLPVFLGDFCKTNRPSSHPLLYTKFLLHSIEPLGTGLL